MLASVFPRLRFLSNGRTPPGRSSRVLNSRLELWSRRSTSLGSRGSEFGFKELLYPPQDFRSPSCFVDRLPERSASRDAVRKPRCELFHLAFSSGHFLFKQHLEIRADHLVAISLGGLVVKLTS